MDLKISERTVIRTIKIKAVLWQEDGVWCGSVPALPGCHTWGDSYEHLLEMLQEAVQAWLEVASKREEIEPEKQLVDLRRSQKLKFTLTQELPNTIIEI